MVKAIDNMIQRIGIKKTFVGVGSIATGGLVASTALAVIGVLAILASQGLLPGAFSSLAGLHTGGGIAFIAIATLGGTVSSLAFCSVSKKTKALSEKVKNNKTQTDDIQANRTLFGIEFQDFIDDEELIGSIEKLNKRQRNALEIFVVDFDRNVKSCKNDEKKNDSMFFNFTKETVNRITFFLKDEVEKDTSGSGTTFKFAAIIPDLAREIDRETSLPGITEMDLLNILAGWVVHQKFGTFAFVNNDQGLGGIILHG